MAMAFAPDKVKSEAAKMAVYRLISQTKTIATDDDAEKPKLSDAAGDICFVGVTFSYPTRPDRLVFKDLSLVIPAGKQTALVGATGCGKSSCVALLQRFYDPSAGAITIGGQAITGVSVQALRAGIGLVSQEPVLFAASIRENVRYGQITAQDLINHFTINVVPHVLLTQFLGPRMVAKGWGRILIGGSIGVKFGGWGNNLVNIKITIRLTDKISLL